MVQLLGNATKSRKGVRAAVVGWFCPGCRASQLVNDVDEQFVGKVVHGGENLRLDITILLKFGDDAVKKSNVKE